MAEPAPLGRDIAWLAVSSPIASAAVGGGTGTAAGSLTWRGVWADPAVGAAAGTAEAAAGPTVAGESLGAGANTASCGIRAGIAARTTGPDSLADVFISGTAGFAASSPTSILAAAGTNAGAAGTTGVRENSTPAALVDVTPAAGAGRSAAAIGITEAGAAATGASRVATGAIGAWVAAPLAGVAGGEPAD